MIRKVDELTEPPIIGRFYLVPCIRIPDSGFYHDFIPITGPLHNDLDINFEMWHYHRDPRFISDDLLAPAISGVYTRAEATLGRVVAYSADQPEEVVYKRRKCVREMPVFPMEGTAGTVKFKVPIIPTLEKKFIGAKIKCGRCPHKGMPLLSLPRNNRHQVICNGHGLLCDLKAGKVVKRNR